MSAAGRIHRVPFEDSGESLFDDVVRDVAIIPEFEAVVVRSRALDCRIRFWTMVEPIRRADGVLWPTSLEYAQKIADYLGHHLHTAKMLDFRHFAAGYHVDSFWNFSHKGTFNTGGGTPTTPKVVISQRGYSELLDEYSTTVACRRPGSLIKSGLSRDWILHSALWSHPKARYQQSTGDKVPHKGFSVTHGWYSNSATSTSQATPGMKLEDSCRKHYGNHAVLSDSFVTLAHRDCDIELPGESWQTVALADVLVDPTLAPLICHHGTIPARAPNVSYRAAPRLVFADLDWNSSPVDPGPVVQKRRDLWRASNK
jgi:hypothetical protein